MTHTTTHIVFAFGLLGLLVFGTWSSPSAEPEHLVQRMNSAAPKPPAACFATNDASTDAEVTWMVFTAPGCAPCHRWLDELSENTSKLGSHGIQVRHYVTGVDSCLGAARVAGRHRRDFPLGVSDDRASTRWAVHSTPTTYVLRGDRVIGAVVGVASLADVLSLSNREGR